MSFPLPTIVRMKPTPFTSSPPGVSGPSPPSHKLELQTLKLEELTVSLGSNLPGWPFPSVRTQKSNPATPAPSDPSPSSLSFHKFSHGREPSQASPHPSPQVSELRQQLRLRGLPVSGTKSMLLERMRGGAPPRERPKPRREDSPLDAPWPRFRAKALGASRRPGSVRAGLCACRPMRRRQSGTGKGSREKNSQ